MYFRKLVKLYIKNLTVKTLHQSAVKSSESLARCQGRLKPLYVWFLMLAFLVTPTPWGLLTISYIRLWQNKETVSEK